ncbi:MAG TPA: substrate-binding domain-containing protein [Capsulimonadaceae bacterium]|jgi:DNA-binding LacI/PurR family transcriptional regulator
MQRTAERKNFTAVAPYQRIENDLRARLARGDWAVGTQFPSRRELAKQYGVELKTLQRAMGALLSDHLLKADGTRGTIVLALPSSASSTATATDSPTQATSVHGARIGVLLVGKDRHTWSHILLRTVERQVSRAGGSSIFRQHVDPAAGVDDLLSIGCSVIVVDGIHANEQFDAVWRAVNGRVPVVFVSNEDFKRPVLTVYYDSFDAGYQAGEYLVNKGIRDILFVAGGNYPWIYQRLNGINAALVAHGLPSEALTLTSSMLGHVDGRYEDAGLEAASAAFTRHIPEAIIACNDRTAFGAMRAAEQRGLVLGEDIAIVGYDDEPESSSRGLTTFQPPLEEMGVEAARLAVKAITSGIASQRICLHSHLIERRSTTSTRKKLYAGSIA